MSRNTSGTYSRITPPGAGGYVSGTVIKPGDVNGEINDIKNEITDSVSRSGKGAALANLPMGGFKHTGVAQATANGEYVEFSQFSSLSTTVSQKANTQTPTFTGGNATISGSTSFVSLQLNNNSGNSSTQSNFSMDFLNENSIPVAGYQVFYLPDGSSQIDFNTTIAGARNIDRRTGTKLVIKSNGAVSIPGRIESPSAAKAFIYFSGSTGSIIEQYGGLTVSVFGPGHFKIFIPAGVVNTANYTVSVSLDGLLIPTVTSRTLTDFIVFTKTPAGVNASPFDISLTIFGV